MYCGCVHFDELRTFVMYLMAQTKQAVEKTQSPVYECLRVLCRQHEPGDARVWGSDSLCMLVLLLERWSWITHISVYECTNSF